MFFRRDCVRTTEKTVIKAARINYWKKLLGGKAKKISRRQKM